jgi:hypothetical protein
MSANGRLLPAELVAVQGSIQLSRVTGVAWLNFEQAMRRLGFEPNVTAPFGGYRNLADQTFMAGHPSTSTTGTVARPGKSVHGDGSCVDISNWANFGRARDVGSLGRWYSRALDQFIAPYGFRRTFKGTLWEPWHYQHDRVTSSAIGAPTTFFIPHNLSEEDDDDMLIIGSKGTGEFAIAGRTYRRVEGSWLSNTNLEGNILGPKLIAAGAVRHDFDVKEIEIMFAVDGLWEQGPLPEATWGGVSTPLKGDGPRTGRRIYPGAPGIRGQWHFPSELELEQEN